MKKLPWEKQDYESDREHFYFMCMVGNPNDLPTFKDLAHACCVSVRQIYRISRKNQWEKRRRIYERINPYVYKEMFDGQSFREYSRLIKATNVISSTALCGFEEISNKTHYFREFSADRELVDTLGRLKAVARGVKDALEIQAGAEHARKSMERIVEEVTAEVEREMELEALAKEERRRKRLMRPKAKKDKSEILQPMEEEVIAEEYTRDYSQLNEIQLEQAAKEALIIPEEIHEPEKHQDEVNEPQNLDSGDDEYLEDDYSRYPAIYYEKEVRHLCTYKEDDDEDELEAKEKPFEGFFNELVNGSLTSIKKAKNWLLLLPFFVLLSSFTLDNTKTYVKLGNVKNTQNYVSLMSKSNGFMSLRCQKFAFSSLLMSKIRPNTSKYHRRKMNNPPNIHRNLLLRKLQLSYTYMLTADWNPQSLTPKYMLTAGCNPRSKRAQSNPRLLKSNANPRLLKSNANPRSLTELQKKPRLFRRGLLNNIMASFYPFFIFSAKVSTAVTYALEWL